MKLGIILFTLFIQILTYGAAPRSWSVSNITVIRQSCQTSDPCNFRMITALLLGKTYISPLREQCVFIVGTFRLRIVIFFCLEDLPSYSCCSISVLHPFKEIQWSLQLKTSFSQINGFLGHRSVQNVLLVHSRSQTKTLHCTIFDLLDALIWFYFPRHISHGL